MFSLREDEKIGICYVLLIDDALVRTVGSPVTLYRPRYLILLSI